MRMWVLPFRCKKCGERLSAHCENKACIWVLCPKCAYVWDLATKHYFYLKELTA